MKRYERLLVVSLISVAFYLPALHAEQPPVPPTEKVGLQKNGSVVLPDSQVIEPAGHQITVLGRPSVIAIRPDHKTAVVINAQITALKNNIPLNQLTTQQTAARTSKLQLAGQQESAKMFARPQRADSADPNILNHAIWYATKGFNKPYPGDKTVLFPSQVKRSPYRTAYED